MPKNNEYDVIVIGAGIGGLVCGCYLAKAGMKVLMIEKNAKVGGYCTSFALNGFNFDAFVHSLGSLRKGEIIANILKDLDVDKRIKFKRYNPSDIVISPDYKISFRNESGETIEEFKKAFPGESEGIDKFFKYINGANNNHAALRRKNFKELLDDFFNDDQLKAILSLFTLGNIGLPPSLLSAFTAVKFYKQFMLDGGYYPENGMQSFSDLLAVRFRELGGDLLLCSRVSGIEVEGDIVKGVTIKNSETFFSKYVVSACDVRQTFLDLIGKEKIGKIFLKTIDDLQPTLSMFIMYLGFKEHFEELPLEGVNTWVLPDYDLDKMYRLAVDGEKIKPSWYMLRLLSDKKSMMFFTDVPFRNENYWRKHKELYFDHYLDDIKKVIPNLEKYLQYKSMATPYTLYKLTLNYKGSSYGWAPMNSQFGSLSQSTYLKNMFLAGHWTTLAQGVPGVSYIGKSTASIILRKNRKHL